MNGAHRQRLIVMASCLCITLLWPGLAGADGGLIITEVSRTEEVPGGTQSSAALSGLVSSSGQRAVLWLSDDGCWDMFVDPGDIEISGAAWIMPLPVVPEAVEQASADFIDHIDAATLPLLITEYTRIVEYYTYASGGYDDGFGCGFDEAAPGLADGEEYEGEETFSDGVEGRGVQPPVQVWQSGRLGDVEYDVVSSDDPAALESWLADHEYVNPDGLSSLLEEYTNEGYVFFAARLSRSPEDGTRVPVFRFSLCNVDNPEYPVRLSTLSVSTSLEFTLWFVLPSAHRGYMPTNATLGYFGDFYERSIDTDYQDTPDFEQLYRERRDETRSVIGGRGLTVELATDLTSSAVEQRVEVEGASSSSFPLTMDREDWSDELETIVSNNLRVVRLSGSFPVASMDEDIYFVPGDMLTDSGVYRREVVEYDYEYTSEPTEETSPEEEEVEPIFDDVSSCRISTGGESTATSDRRLPLYVLIVVAGLLLWRRFRLS